MVRAKYKLFIKHKKTAAHKQLGDRKRYIEKIREIRRYTHILPGCIQTAIKLLYQLELALNIKEC